MKQRSLTLLGLLPLVLPPETLAQDEPAELRVKPVLCITDNPDGTCEAHFRVHWTSRRIGPFCLDNDLESEPLYCWDRAASGRSDEEREVSGSFHYRLQMPGRALPVAEARVEVMSVHEPDRRRSRRNRHAWSIL